MKGKVFLGQRGFDFGAKFGKRDVIRFLGARDVDAGFREHHGGNEILALSKNHDDFALILRIDEEL